MADVEVSYQTITEEPRTGPVGRLLRWIGAHPLIAGLIGGTAAVLIAMARAFEGVQSAPADALIISAVVILAWVVLFYFLRGFFEQQAMRTVDVRRDLQAEDGVFRWLENGEEVRVIADPEYRLYTTPVPEHMLDDRNADQPWPVWLVISSADEKFVLETKITAGEANAYDEVDSEVIEQVDETLPTGLASPLLSCAERKA